MADKIQFYTGLQGAYDALVEASTIDDHGIYFITDSQRLYKGNILIADVAKSQVVFTDTTPEAGSSENDILYVATVDGKTTIYVKSGDTMETVGGGEAQSIADGVIEFGNFNTDTIATSISDTPSESKIATEKAVKDYVDGIKSTIDQTITGLTDTVNTAFDDVAIVAGGQGHENQFGIQFSRVGDTNPTTIYLDKEQYLLNAEIDTRDVGEPPEEKQCLVLTVQILDGQGGTTSREVVVPIDELVQVNASTVNTTTEIKVTTAVGNYNVGDTIPASDLQSILTKMLSADRWMGQTNPKMGGSITLPTSLEIGTTVTPSFNNNFVQGSYTKDNGAAKDQPSPDNPITSWSATFTGQDEQTGGTETSFTGSFTPVQAESTGKTLTVVCNYGVAANGPYTFLGNTEIDGVTSDQKKIPAGSVNQTKTLTGFRQGYFWGMLATSTTDEPLTSSVIRGVASAATSDASSVTGAFKGSAYSAGDIGTSAKPISASKLSGVKRIFVACPATNKGVTKVVMPSAMGADATADFVKQSSPVSIEGVEGYEGINYNVWVFEPASISSDMTFVVTLG